MWGALLSLGPSLLARKWLIVGVLVAIMACAAAVSLYGWSKFRAGEAKDRARSDQIIARMVTDAQKAFNASEARRLADEEAMRLLKQGAQRAREADVRVLEGRLAAERADAVGLRKQLATFASGGVEAAKDSVAACRERSATAGDVLAGVLQDLAVCTGAAEDHASGVRTLLTSWPRTAGETVTP